MTRHRKNGRVRVVAPSRAVSSICRAPIVPATVGDLDAGNRGAVARLIAHVLTAIVDPSATNRRRVRDYKHAMVRAGRGDLANAVASALGSDGGMLVRALARACLSMRDAAQAAALAFVDAVDEHRIESATARALLARSALESAAVDAMLAAMVAGEAPPETGKVAASLSAAARIDLLTALQLEREARDAQRAALPAWPVMDSAQPAPPRPAKAQGATGQSLNGRAVGQSAQAAQRANTAEHAGEAAGDDAHRSDPSAGASPWPDVARGRTGGTEGIAEPMRKAATSSNADTAERRTVAARSAEPVRHAPSARDGETDTRVSILAVPRASAAPFVMRATAAAPPQPIARLTGIPVVDVAPVRGSVVGRAPDPAQMASAAFARREHEARTAFERELTSQPKGRKP